MSDVAVEEQVDETNAEHDQIAKDQDQVAATIRDFCRALTEIERCIRMVSGELDDSGMLRDSASARFFALFSQVRDEVKKIDEAIGAEIDTESMSSGRKHKIGRLQKMVQDYFERIGARNASAEGKLVQLTRRLWATATNIPALKGHEVTREFVKETVNGRTLTSWINELDKNEQGMPALPDELTNAIRVGEKFSVSARKA